MRRRLVFLLKLAGVLGVLAVLAGAAASLALKHFLPPDKLRVLVSDGARKALDREVRFKDVRLSLLKGLVVEGLEISERPDFKAGRLAAADSFTVRVAYRALLRRKLVVSRVSAEGLTLSIVKGRDGRYNFEMPASTEPVSAAAAAAPAAVTAASLELAIGRAQVTGSVIYRDEAQGVEWKFSGLDAKLRDFKPGRPFGLDLKLRAQGRHRGRPIDAVLAFSGTLDPERPAASIKKLTLEQGGLAVELSGKAAGIAPVELDLKGRVRQADKELLSLEAVGRASTAPAAALAVKVRTLGLDRAALKALEVSSLLPEGLVIPGLSLDTRFELEGQALLIEAFQLKGKAGAVQGSGSVRGFSSAKPEYALSASADVDLPRLRQADVPYVKWPEGLVIPAVRLTAKLRLERGELRVESFSAQVKEGTLAAAGSVRGLFTPKLEPNIEVTAKLSLPAFQSSDLPFAGVPAGLLVPAAKIDAALFLGSDQLRFHPLRVALGGTDLEVQGTLRDLKNSPVFDLALKCPAFVLDELARLSPGTRELGLTGRGFFAAALTGRKDKPLFSGKLTFKGVGASAFGLKLSEFAGTARFDERRLDARDLKGRLADGALALDLTVRDYAKAPAVELAGSLSKFDLGAFLAAQEALEKSKANAPASAPPAAKAEPKKPLSAKGRFAVAKLVHPKAVVEDVRLAWDLTGLEPGFKRLGGSAQLQVARGRITSLGQLATQSAVVKVLLLPLVIVQKVVGITGLKIFPDFDNIEFSEIAGDYAFRDGLMTVRDSHLYSEAANVTTQGTIDLPSEKIDLVVTAQVARVAPLDIAVKGTFDAPVAKAKIGKFLAEPAKQLLEGIFKIR